MATRIDVSMTRSDTFERVVRNLGNSPELRTAMSRGLNEHLRKQQRQATLVIAAQTGIPRGRVDSGSSVRLSSPATLSGAVQQKGPAVPAGSLTSMSWSKSDRGAKHRDWPTYTDKGGLMRGTFMAKGALYRRTTLKRFPIVKVWGPVLPNELLRKDMPARQRADGLVGADLEKSVIRSIMHSFGY